jgi:hypothetical protein
MARIRMEITARGGTIFLNGDDEATLAREFFVPAVAGGNGDTSITAVTHTISGNYTVVNSGQDDEYYRVAEDRTVTIEVTGIVQQAAPTAGFVLAGMTASEIQFGTDASTDLTRSAFSLDFDDLLDEIETGRVALTNPS